MVILARPIHGDPCVKKCTNKWRMPVYEQLEFAKREVEMIGKNS